MASSFRGKLTATYLVIILAILGVSGIFLSIIFKNHYLHDIKSNLVYEAKLISQMTEYNNQSGEIKSFLQVVTDEAAVNTDSRVTIIAQDGIVLADSIFAAETMDLHNTRPEVFAALKGETGSNIRLSDTAATQMLYVAIPFDSGEIQGVIRIAKPLAEVQTLYHNILYILLLGILATGLIAFAFSIGIARRFAYPIQEVTGAVRDIAQGNLKRRITYKAEDELGILATAVNNMTDYLETTINEISTVKNRLETLLENTVNGILMIDINGKVTYANPVALELVNGNRDFLGRSYVEIIKNYDLITIVDEVINNSRAIRKDIIIMHTTDEKMVEVNVVPIITKNKVEYNGVLLVLNDITEMKRLEQVRKDFVANVSHELKTPLATISGFAETLMGEDIDSEHIKEFSSIIYDEAQHLSNLIARLLELSKLESGKLELQLEDVPLKEVIDSAITLIKKRFSNQDVNIRVEMWPPDLTVKGDYEFTNQILINLLENAVNYSPPGQEILIETADLGNEVKIMVKDQGEGIPDQDLPRLFERFYRVDKCRTKKTGGTGLGLSIVKHLAENQGGNVGVTSEFGRGSTFFFTLPKY